MEAMVCDMCGKAAREEDESAINFSHDGIDYALELGLYKFVIDLDDDDTCYPMEICKECLIKILKED